MYEVQSLQNPGQYKYVLPVNKIQESGEKKKIQILHFTERITASKYF